MSLSAASKGVAITNPLVLYRALLATNRIIPDPAQHRLAIHLQKLYDRLKDYEPPVQYSERLNQISKAVGSNGTQQTIDDKHDILGLGRRGLWQSIVAEKERKDSTALTRVLTSHERARDLDSPKGLMLHGEVGTGKSMLIDLFADCLPNQKKRRWHFNTFILDVIATLEQIRRDNLLRAAPASPEDYSMLVLARDLIKKSPILFLDEFQLPDRAASKIMANLMTAFFQLGGVLIATSNRMPEDLHKAAGITYSPPPTRMDSLRWKLGLNPSSRKKTGSANMFAYQEEYSEFLDVLKARCEVWEMENSKDYRRQEYGTVAPASEDEGQWVLDEQQDLQKLRDELDLTEELQINAQEPADSNESASSPSAPAHYHIQPDLSPQTSLQSLTAVIDDLQSQGHLSSPPKWQPTIMRVYGRSVPVPRASNGISQWTFTELCSSLLGPADYLTLASTFHTIILTDVPILTLLRKNEARRFITLLDALYEARCKLLITAAAGPDEIFFPDQANRPTEGDSADAVYAETLAEAYQDVTSPFRPNVLSSNPDFREDSETYYVPRREPDYTHSRLSGMLAPDALEDDPPNRVLRARERQRERDAGPIDPDASRVRKVDFQATGAFTGEDERFAFKRARSRLWEMCGRKWWARNEEGWWRPLPKEVRRWERAIGEIPVPSMGRVEEIVEDEVQGDVVMGKSRGVDEQQDEVMFRHGASPFRVAREPPPKFSWAHVWGTVKWGKRAGAWGQGPEGLKDRKKEGDV
ncbi:AFG1-like ATPase-domain-containing protein [Elsinoe ampelina]|uniref:AFG1-like ATPase-domain-containing protein n=1 Tax=Elsinoe ampelina TaxID=302913 RepID=A0A6A6GCZ3_9PEZI|nr:AFG1-like ATPase-domain-containing protein [Elsinoe ampelina]